MPYNKTNWVNRQAPFLNDENLNKIEDAIEHVTNIAESNVSDISMANLAIQNLIAADAEEYTYTNSDPIVVPIGDIGVGETFENVSLTELLTRILYPYQAPSFDSFSITGQNTVLEVGDTITFGVKPFTWSTLNDANIIPSTISITDITTSTVIGSNLDNDGAEGLSVDAITENSATNHVWRIAADGVRNEVISRDFTVNWRWRMYYGTSALESLTETDVKALANDYLASGRTASLSVTSGDYKYIAYPQTFGLATAFNDPVSGFPVAMEAPVTVNITNAFGVSQDYYVYRTTNPVLGSFTINVE